MESHRKDVKRKQINRSKIVITQSKIKIEKKKIFVNLDYLAWLLRRNAPNQLRYWELVFSAEMRHTIIFVPFQQKCYRKTANIIIYNELSLKSRLIWIV